MTHPEQIVAAARMLPLQFSLEQLIVQTWESDKAAFGLSGFNLPDSRKVYICLVGPKGLLRRGWIIKARDGSYSLSEAAGRRNRLDGQPKPRSEARGDVNVVKRWAASLPFDLFRQGRAGDIRFTDAGALYGLKSDMSSDFVNEAIARPGDEIRAVLASMNGEPLVLDREVIEKATVAQLAEMDEYLRERFHSHFKLLTQRAARAV